MNGISALASSVLYIAAIITLVLSCMHGELFWNGLIVMIAAVAMSFLEGIILVPVIGIGSLVYHYIRAKLAHDVEEVKRCKQELKEMTSNFSLVFQCPFTLVVAVPLTLYSVVSSGVKAIIGMVKVKCFLVEKP